MERYSADTVELARSWIDAWERQRDDAEAPPVLAFYRSHVRFEADPEEREALRAVGTRLELPREEVEMLVRAGARILGRSEDFRRLTDDLGATRARAPACPMAAPVP
jgi:hypothetical protein